MKQTRRGEKNIEIIRKKKNFFSLKEWNDKIVENSTDHRKKKHAKHAFSYFWLITRIIETKRRIMLLLFIPFEREFR